MKVKDVMTRDPISVRPEAKLKHVAELLVQHGISGLLVVGAEGELLGVVSEADIVTRQAGAGTEAEGSGWWLFFSDVPMKVTARTAGEAMSSPAIAVRPEHHVSEAARVMIERSVNRLPVVDADGALIGIVTRADLVRALTRSDEEIRQEIEEEVIASTFSSVPGCVTVVVERGDVTLGGRVDTKADAELVRRLVERVPGVVSVTSELTSSSASLPTS